MRYHAALLVGLLLVLPGCRPDFAEEFRLGAWGLLTLKDPAKAPSCTDYRQLELRVNGTLAPAPWASEAQCVASQCICRGPRWNLLLDPEVPPDVHELTFRFSEGDDIVMVRVRGNPLVPSPQLIGSTTLRRGEEREIRFHSVSVPLSPGQLGLGLVPDGTGAWDVMVRAATRLEGHSLFFTLPRDAPRGFVRLKASRVYPLQLLECGFERCLLDEQVDDATLDVIVE